MEILNSGKKVEQCDPVARTANQQLITEASTAGGSNFTNPVSLAGGTDRILFLHVVTGLNVNEPTLSVTNVDIGGITPTLLNTKTITTTGAGLNLEYTNSVYYILESDIASLGTLPIVTVDTDIPLSGVGGGVNVRATQYENVNQAAPFFATNQNCIDGTVPNPHMITVPSCENGLTHWQYSKASAINDSYNANNIMDGLIQASGLVQNTGYQEGDLTNPHLLEINQLAGTFKGVIANGFNLFTNCIKFPETQCTCTVASTTELVDRSHIVTADTFGDANETGEIHTLIASRADAAFTVTGNSIITAIPMDHVELHLVEWYQPSDVNNTLLQRIAPVMELYKNGNLVATSATGYQRHATNHTESSNSISWIDSQPLVGDVYEVISRQESSQDDVLNITQGHFHAKGVEKVPVVVDVTIN